MYAWFVKKWTFYRWENTLKIIRKPLFWFDCWIFHVDSRLFVAVMLPGNPSLGKNRAQNTDLLTVDSCDLQWLAQQRVVPFWRAHSVVESASFRPSVFKKSGWKVTRSTTTTTSPLPRPTTPTRVVKRGGKESLPRRQHQMLNTSLASRKCELILLLGVACAQFSPPTSSSSRGRCRIF